MSRSRGRWLPFSVLRTRSAPRCRGAHTARPDHRSRRARATGAAPPPVQPLHPRGHDRTGTDSSAGSAGHDLQTGVESADARRIAGDNRGVLSSSQQDNCSINEVCRSDTPAQRASGFRGIEIQHPHVHLAGVDQAGQPDLACSVAPHLCDHACGACSGRACSDASSTRRRIRRSFRSNAMSAPASRTTAQARCGPTRPPRPWPDRCPLAFQPATQSDPHAWLFLHRLIDPRAER